MLPLVKGPKVMDNWLLSCSMARCVLFPHYPNYNEQIKGPEFISSVAYLHLESVAVNCQDEIQRAVTISEAAIIRLKKQNKPIREIAKNIRRGQTNCWNILKKKERTGELSNTKRPGRPRKTTVVDDRRILSLVKKKHPSQQLARSRTLSRR